jgi:hypothetical protein
MRCSMRTDGQTGMTKLTTFVRNCPNSQKKKKKRLEAAIVRTEKYHNKCHSTGYLGGQDLQLEFPNSRTECLT